MGEDTDESKVAIQGVKRELEADKSQGKPVDNSPQLIMGANDANKNKSFIKKRLLFCAAGLTIFIIIFAIATLGLNTGHKYTVFGIKVPYGASQAQIENLLQDKFKTLQIAVQNSDKKVTKFKYSDAGVGLDVNKTAKNVSEKIAKASLIDKIAWWKNRSTIAIITVDQAKLDQFVAANTVNVIKQPVDATLTIDNGQVVNTASQEGSAYIVKDAAKSIVYLAKKGQSFTLLQTKQTLQPSITTDMVKQVKAQADIDIQKPITFTVKGQNFTPTKETVASWVEPINSGSQKPELQFNKDKILLYIDRIASNFVGLPQSEIAITGDDGVKRVYVVGQSGTDITNKEEVATSVAQDLLTQASVQKTLQISTKSYSSITPDYDKWILVSLSAHKLQAYEHTNLIKEIKVSAGAPATPTVTGKFKIFTKIRKEDMSGLNADGTRYLQPNVEWVNYFYKDYALHGNYWRPTSWFGTKNGSHGCVGMLNPDAQWVYNWAPIGTTVIVY